MKKKMIVFLMALSMLLPCACLNTEPLDSSSSGQGASSSFAPSSGETDSVDSSSSGTSVDSSSSTGDSSSSGGNASDSTSSSGGASTQSSSSATEAYCTVSFDTDGAGEIASVKVEKGELLEEPEPPQKTTKECEYEFLGWFVGDEEWDFDNDVVTEDVTLVAHWKEGDKYSNPFLPKD